jgi:hypothetical protein
VQAGGAIANFGGTVDIRSSTFTGNAASLGAAVYNNLGTVSILNSTVAENNSRFGGALYSPDGLLRVQNTIVANNTESDPTGFGLRPDCRGDITSLGNNIIGDVSGCNINLRPSDHVGDPGLGALVGDDDENTPPGEIYYPLWQEVWRSMRGIKKPAQKQISYKLGGLIAAISAQLSSVIGRCLIDKGLQPNPREWIANDSVTIPLSN